MTQGQENGGGYHSTLLRGKGEKNEGHDLFNHIETFNNLHLIYKITIINYYIIK